MKPFVHFFHKQPKSATILKYKTKQKMEKKSHFILNVEAPIANDNI